MIGQMTIDDFLCENEVFSWDADINYIYDKLNRLSKRFNLATEKAKAEWLELFRTMIEEIPWKLSQRNYIYKVGMAYGFYDSRKRKVKFYFEKCKESEG